MGGGQEREDLELTTEECSRAGDELRIGVKEVGCEFAVLRHAVGANMFGIEASLVDSPAAVDAVIRNPGLFVRSWLTRSRSPLSCAPFT